MTARPLGPCDVLTLDEAAAALRVRRETAIAWLRAEGLVRVHLGRELVPWGEVYQRLVRGAPEEPAPVPRRSTGRRATL